MKMTNPLANLFARSPFGPLQDHMRIVERCVGELPALLDSVEAGDGGAARARRAEVFRLEHEADEVKNSIRSALPSTLFLPVARRDLLDLLATQDAVADAAQDAAGLLGMGKLRFVPAMAAPLRAFLLEVVEVVGHARALVEQLDELVEVGFRGKEAEKLLVMIDEVSVRESVTDAQGAELVDLLFDHEDDVGPLSVVFWYELIRMLGRVADEAENVGDRLRLLVAR